MLQLTPPFLVLWDIILLGLWDDMGGGMAWLVDSNSEHM